MVQKRWIRYTLWILILCGSPHIEGFIHFNPIKLIIIFAHGSIGAKDEPSSEPTIHGRWNCSRTSKYASKQNSKFLLWPIAYWVHDQQFEYDSDLVRPFLPECKYVLTSESRRMIAKVLLRSKITDVRVLRLEMALAELIPSLISFFKKQKKKKIEKTILKRLSMFGENGMTLFIFS